MITASPETMTWAREHIPANVLQGMLEDGFLKEIKEIRKEIEKNGE